MARRGITALLLATLLSAGGCYDSHFSEAAGGAAAWEGNTPLSELRARYTGRPTLVEEDIRVVGYVTTSDRAGNFYRTLCIEQAGAALEVMVGLDHLHNDYPPGSRLMVRLRGLTLGLQYGVLQAGTRAEPGSGYATGYLGSRPQPTPPSSASTAGRASNPPFCTSPNSRPNGAARWSASRRCNSVPTTGSLLPRRGAATIRLPMRRAARSAPTSAPMPTLPTLRFRPARSR